MALRRRTSAEAVRTKLSAQASEVPLTEQASDSCVEGKRELGSSARLDEVRF
jgi:hypothetical protein